MKITIPKSSLSEILYSLTKIADGFVVIAAASHTVTFTRTGTDSQLAIASPTAYADEDGAATVSLKTLSAALSKFKAHASIGLKSTAHVLQLLDGDTLLEAIPLEKPRQEPLVVPAAAETLALPTGFASFVLSAFAMASRDKTRAALMGVSLSAKGIAASDGKQLYHLPLPLKLKDGLTMPRNPVLPILAKQRWTHLTHWKDDSGDRWLSIHGDGFRFAMKALQGDYPAFWNAFPDPKTLNVKFTIREGGIARATEFLKKLPPSTDGNGIVYLWFLNDRLVMQEPVGNAWIAVPIDNIGSVGKTTSRSEYLLRALQLGHSTFQTASKSGAAILAGGGAGTYLWMPYHDESPSEPPKESLAFTLEGSTTALVPRPATVPAIPHTPTTASPQTTKENPMVTTASATAPVPAASFRNFAPSAVQPGQGNVTIPPQPAIDPLTAASIAVADLKSTIEALESKFQDVNRRLREALVLQKQRERQYQDATRKLERIRLAV